MPAPGRGTVDVGCGEGRVSRELRAAGHDVDDLPGAVDEIARVLVPGGLLCVAVVHPINQAGDFVSRDADSPYLIEGSYDAPRRHADALERDGLGITFHSVHRPLEAYTRALERSSFVIEARRSAAVTSPHGRRRNGQRGPRLPYRRG